MKFSIIMLDSGGKKSRPCYCIVKLTVGPEAFLPERYSKVIGRVLVNANCEFVAARS